MNNTSDFQTVPCSAPVFADPLVEVEVVLPVLVGEAQFSLDTAIDRLGEIQDEERRLKKEKDPLRKATEATLRDNGIESHATALGRSATPYEQTKDQWPDRAYLASILTPEQMTRAFPEKKIKGLRIR